MIKHLNLIAVITFLLAPISVWANTASGRIIMAFDLSAHDSSREARLWIPYPTTNKNQTVTNITMEGDYSSSGVYTDSVFQTPMLYAGWEPGAQNRTLTFSFDVTRQEIIRRDFPDKETAWDPVDYSLYLAPTRLGPVDGAVKKLAEKITSGQTTVLGKAKAIYDWTCANTYRNPGTRGCGSGDVYALLKEPGGKCADISSIFVALTRAANVPSREIFGLRQGKKTVEDISQWQHCWAEFYLPGYGWVPVDPADVRKAMLKENLILLDARTAEYQKHFWGSIDPYRIKLSEGRDLTLNPPQSGPPVNYLMYPFAQVGKKTIDWLEPETFKYQITYQQK